MNRFNHFTTSFLIVGCVLATLHVTAFADQVDVVTTFESAGIRVELKGSFKGQSPPIQFRERGATAWRDAFPMWYDERDQQLRGSVVGLQPGTAYEGRIRRGGRMTMFQFKTWPAKFPVAETINLPRRSDQTLWIRRSGTPQGYLRYRPQTQRGLIDVKGSSKVCVRISASYVVLQKMDLRKAAVHGILLDDGVHDVVIEDCDISGWGRIDERGWGVNMDSAIFSRGKEVRKIVIQGCRLHHPRSNSNSWMEVRPVPGKPNNRHPGGPLAICLAHSRGNHVIRFNSCYSDPQHQFNDVFGGAENYSRVGFPNRDSDIYGNDLRDCVDDAIEAEGGNCNVRIWGNRINESYVAIATATTSVGPLYVYRNVVGSSRKSPQHPMSKENQGAFLKHSDRMAGGRIFVLHNTLLQGKALRASGASASSRGVGTGLGWGGPIVNVVSRNNILDVAGGAAINDRNRDRRSSYDFDLINGRTRFGGGNEPNGITGAPVWTESSIRNLRPGNPDIVPAAQSPSVDTATKLPNFNDNFEGRGPDIGAQEMHGEVMRYGADAFRGDLRH